MAPSPSPPLLKNGEGARSERAITIDVLVHATKLTVAKHENLEHYLRRLTHLTLSGDARKAVRRIANLHHCPNLRVLYLYDNDIGVIEGLESVPQLTHVHLQNNQFEKLERLDCLPLLEKLYVEGNRIARLEGLHSCCFLQELHLSNQQLASDVMFSFDSVSLQALSVGPAAYKQALKRAIHLTFVPACSLCSSLCHERATAAVTADPQCFQL